MGGDSDSKKVTRCQKIGILSLGQRGPPKLAAKRLNVVDVSQYEEGGARKFVRFGRILSEYCGCGSNQ